MSWKAIISTEGNGFKLLKILVNVGDEVRKGQLLALFDEASVRTELAQHEASLAETNAYLSEARLNADRARSLRRTGAMSEQDISQYQTKLHITQAQFDAAQARVKAQKLKLGYTRVVAPDDGIISFKGPLEGSIIGNGTELFRLLMLLFEDFFSAIYHIMGASFIGRRCICSIAINAKKSFHAIINWADYVNGYGK